MFLLESPLPFFFSLFINHSLNLFSFFVFFGLELLAFFFPSVFDVLNDVSVLLLCFHYLLVETLYCGVEDLIFYC
jgi:hypothetical protein